MIEFMDELENNIRVRISLGLKEICRVRKNMDQATKYGWVRKKIGQVRKYECQLGYKIWVRSRNFTVNKCKS